MHILAIVVAVWMIINIFISAFAALISSMGWFVGGAFILIVLGGLLGEKK